MLTVVGLGPGSRQYLSVQVYDAIRQAERVFVRTSRHPVLETLDVPFESFDHLYDQAENFEVLYQEIARQVLEAAQHQDVVYAVPGSPFIAERSVEHLLGQPGVKVIPGVSFLEPLMQALRLDPTDGLTILDALSAFKAEPDRQMLFLQIYSKDVASQVKLRLMESIEDERLVTIVRWAGIEGRQELISLPLYAMDHEDHFDHLTTLYVPAGKHLPRDIASLLHVMQVLRGPGGCPWDREQTHESLERYLIEESYEVLEAIHSGDFSQLQEELGDLLCQVVFHAQLAEEEGYFTFGDVVEDITKKLIRRHTHIFETDEAATSQDVLHLWEKNKGTEKDLATRIDQLPKSSPLHYGFKLARLLKKKAPQRLTGLGNEALVEQLLELIVEAGTRDLYLDTILMQSYEKWLKNETNG